MLIKLKEMDQLVVFEAPSTEVNDLNEPVGGWVQLFRAWAKVRPVKASDLVAADHPWGLGAYNFTIRQTSCAASLSATGGQRLMWGGKAYYLVGEPMRLNGANGYLMIRATSVKVNDV